MRTGLVIYGSLDTLSGGYLYDRRLVEYLRAQGDQVEVVSQPWGSYAMRVGRNYDMGVLERLANLDVDFLLEDELNHPSLFRLNRELKRAAGYPVISIVHHLLSNELHPPMLLKLYRAVERAYLSGVDGFIFNSQTTRQSVEQLLGRETRGIVAYPGGDQFRAGIEEVENNAHSQHARQEEVLRLLFVGNLIPRKGLHTLLDALALLPPGGWRLDVVGQEQVDPAYTRRVKQLAEPLGQRVRFRGRLDEQDFQQVWRENQVLVVTSSYEGFGIVYLEGMAFGLPAVASTAGAAREIITHGVDGFLVPPEQPEKLAGIISELLADRGRLAEMSAAARRRYEAFPTWEQSGAAVREFLLEWKNKDGR